MGSLTGKKLMPSKVHAATHLPIMNIAKGFFEPERQEGCPALCEAVG